VFADRLTRHRADRRQSGAVERRLAEGLEEVVDGRGTGEGHGVGTGELRGVPRHRAGAVGDGQLDLATAATKFFNQLLAPFLGADDSSADAPLVLLQER